MRIQETIIYNILKFMLPMLALSSCIGFSGLEDEVLVLREYPVVLSASAPSPDTRISVNGVEVAWEEDDKVQITAIASDGTSATSDLTWFSGVDGKDGHTASFSGFVTMASAPQECYFVYPVMTSTSINHSKSEINLYFNSQTGEHKPFMYAKASYDADGIYAKMNHAGAMLEIDVQNSEITSITFKGNMGEVISPMTVNLQNSNISFASNANTEITVPVQQDGKTYIAVPPVAMANGFSLVCANADRSKTMIRSFSSDGGLYSGYDFSTKVGQIIPITISGEFSDFSIESSEPVITHTRYNGLLMGTAVKFTMTKSGVPDKLIDEWGATLVNADGEVVRELHNFKGTPIKGDEMTLTVADSWNLLPAGQYTFSPYYMMYGKKVTLWSKNITVDDPGIEISINGQTSYSKYKAGDINGANSHTNTLIEGVSVTANVHRFLINSYSIKLDDDDISSNISTAVDKISINCGDLTRSTYKSYKMVVSLNLGALTYADSTVFHITGLPYEVSLDDNVWAYGWTHKNIKLVEDHYLFPEGASYIVSPKFHAPELINVSSTMSAYAYGGWGSVSADVTMSVTSGTNGSPSGTVTTYNGTQYFPGQATWIDMERELQFTESASRVCIYTVVDKGFGFYLFGPGLFARSYDLRYR